MDTALIICTHEPVSTMLSRALARAGIPAESAATGATALKLYRAGLHNIVLCDMALPVSSSTELVRQFKKRNAGVAIIWVAGATSMKDPEQVDFCWLGQDAASYFARPLPALLRNRSAATTRRTQGALPCDAISGC